MNIPFLKDWLAEIKNFNPIERIAPQFSLKREIAYQRLQRYKVISKVQKEIEIERRSFELLDGSRKKVGMKMASGNIDSEIYNSLEGLRNYVRQQEFNNGLVAGPIERWTNHVIGRGLLFQSRVKADNKSINNGISRLTDKDAENYNFWAEKYFKVWNKLADQKELLTFYQIQWLAESAIMRDGEALIIVRKSDKKRRPIPTCLDILEIDRLRTPGELITDSNVRNGIRFDEEGAPSIYYILKRHPGDSIQLGLKIDDYDEIPAYNDNGTRKVIHLYKMVRPEQTRGYSKFSAALQVLNMAFRISEAEMFASLEDACMFGIVKTDNPAGFQANSTITDTNGQDFGGNTTYPRLHGFDFGQIQYLNYKEDFQYHSPSRPNDKFAEVFETFCMGAANVLQMPTEIFLNKWKDINYSNARTILLQFYIPVFLRQQYLSDHLCDPVWENVASDLVTIGKLRAPEWVDRKEDYLACEWVPPEKDWVDPKAETEGKMNELTMKVTTPSRIVAGKGGDFDDVIDEFGQNCKKIKETEEKYGIKFTDFSFNGEVKQKSQEDQKEENSKKTVNKNE